ncbi:MarR family transcriptional regulator [Streptomyces pactum]|uniref:MarR family transcriptional regulator n=1 Tax=Streptomyces pactum TaxID=68249 RepID=A0ABS0NMN6_9ACTN|nr:MarR family transcriptional regulator [Streptomyces pactum]MBH5336470.1 MarR family transcriptional regulator [Streptomyces pactum]
MAKPGFGKRSVPDQPPRQRGDFAHLPTREAVIATYIDRLPDGAAIDAKTLAKVLPDYGQQAVRSALNALGAAGHLRRLSGTVGEGRTQWVTRTFFSRQARDDAWWAAFAEGDTCPATPAAPAVSAAPAVPGAPAARAASAVPGVAAAPVAPAVRAVPAGPVPSVRAVGRVERAVRPERGRPAGRPASGGTPTHRTGGPAPRSAGYDALASLGRTDPRMTLSAAECADLEPLAARWLTRGTGPAQLVAVLTAGLPREVHSPGALARSRLTTKLPPEPVPEPAPAPVPAGAEGPAAGARWIMECTGCGVPGRPEALPGGLCRSCRGEPAASGTPGPDAAEVRARVARLRAAARTPGAYAPVPASGP